VRGESEEVGRGGGGGTRGGGRWVSGRGSGGLYSQISFLLWKRVAKVLINSPSLPKERNSGLI